MCSKVFRREEQVHNCSRGKETGALLFQEKETGALLFSGEGTRCYTVPKKKRTGAIMF